MGNKLIADKREVNNLDWNELMAEIDKIENTTVKGTTWTSIDDNAEVEWLFSIEINDKQCMVHRDCLPQYYGTDEDFLKLYDCRNKSKIKAVRKAITKFITWYNNTKK